MPTWNSIRSRCCGNRANVSGGTIPACAVARSVGGAPNAKLQGRGAARGNGQIQKYCVACCAAPAPEPPQGGEGEAASMDSRRGRGHRRAPGGREQRDAARAEGRKGTRAPGRLAGGSTSVVRQSWPMGNAAAEGRRWRPPKTHRGNSFWARSERRGGVIQGAI